MAITRSKNQAKRSEQNILVASYDEDYDVLAVEILGEDTGQLRKLQSDSSGFLKVNIAAGGTGDGAIQDGVTVLYITGLNNIEGGLKAIKYAMNR